MNKYLVRVKYGEDIEEMFAKDVFWIDDFFHILHDDGGRTIINMHKVDGIDYKPLEKEAN